MELCHSAGQGGLDRPGSSLYRAQAVLIVEDANHHLWFAYPEVVLDAIRQVWEKED
jgi:hypothetical protein